MSKRKQYNKLEKALEQKYKAKRENEAVLSKEDFKNGKLTVFGYNHLKQQCDYIPYSENIEIKIPKEYETCFKSTLESMGASELSRIRKDRRENKIVSLMLLFTGILFVMLGNVLEIFQGSFFSKYCCYSELGFCLGSGGKMVF